MMPSTLALAVFLVAGSSNSFAEEVVIHLAGQVKNPGIYRVESCILPEQLFKVCGGINVEWGAKSRLKVIRLARPPSLTTGDKGQKANIVFELAQISDKGGKLLLKSHDVIFVPEKVIYGK